MPGCPAWLERLVLTPSARGGHRAVGQRIAVISGDRDNTAMLTTAGVTCSSRGASVGTLPSIVTGGIPGYAGGAAMSISSMT